MTASLAAPGLPAAPYAGEVGLDLNDGSAGFRIFSPLHASTAKGLFMWRPTGRGTPAVYANDDFGTLAAPGAGVAVANVLSNDWVGGQRATLGNVLLSQVSSPAAGVWLDTSDGAVRVCAGMAAGTYTVNYRICNAVASEFCDSADATVVVRSFALVARADQAYASMHTGGRAIANVLANDSLGTTVPTTATVRLSLVSSSHPGLTLDATTGAVNVAPATPHGTHVLTYRICEIANPVNCAQTTATVMPHSIDAVNDSARASSKTSGVAIASVLANDTFNGARATTSAVRLSLPAPLPYGISLNLSTGAVTVAPKTSSGLYTFGYTICEIASPANCDSATVTLDLSGRSGS